MGETSLWGNPPYGGNRPQRGFIERLLWGYCGVGETAPNAGYKGLLRGYCGAIVKVIEKAIAGY